MRKFVFSAAAIVSLSACGAQGPTPGQTIQQVRAAVEACDFATIVSLMAPHIRRSDDSPESISRATVACKETARADYELTASVFKAAEGLQPTFQKNGTLAVYDLRGLGFPKKYDEIRLMKIDGKWYLLEH